MLTFIEIFVNIFIREEFKLNENKHPRRGELRKQIKEHKITFAVYVFLRTLVILALVLSAISGVWENVFTCSLALVLFLLPAFIEKNFGIELPSTLEVIILLFIFSAEILGEMQSFYIKYKFWDAMLHGINGFLCAAIGFALLDIVNRNKRLKFNISPLYLAIVAFCFSMTIGVLWEFFEYGADVILKTDMQKDAVVNTISSVTLNTDKENSAVIIKNIKDVVIITENGNFTLSDYGINGYLDVGINDTMKDLIVNFVGAIVFSVIGFFYVKYRGRFKFADRFIPKLREHGDKKKK